MNGIELDDLVRYKYLSKPLYAPGGEQAAFIVSSAAADGRSYERRIWLYQEQEQAVRRLSSIDCSGVYFWTDAQRLVFASPAAANEQNGVSADSTDLYLADSRGGEPQLLDRLPIHVVDMKMIGPSTYAILGIINANYPDFYAAVGSEREKLLARFADEADCQVLDEIPFWMDTRKFINKIRRALFIYDPGQKTLRRCTDPLLDITALAVHGEWVFYAGVRFDRKMPQEGQLYCLDSASGQERLLYDGRELMMKDLAVFGDRLICTAARSDRFGVNEHPFFYQVRFDTWKFELLAANEAFIGCCVGSDCRLGGGLSLKAHGDHLYYLVTEENSCRLYRLNRQGESERVSANSGSLDCFDVSDRGQMLSVALLNGKLQELYLSRCAEDHFRQASLFNEDILAGKYVAPFEPLTIISKGQTVDGWVLKPKDFVPGGSYPAILDIHGGPQTAYGQVFFHEMQHWAGAGYFVFFCNPFGSEGRGNEFMDLRGRWGTIDYENIMDFTAAVLEKYPSIDRTRLGVVGGSYGGYMTNWIIGHTDLFACAASLRSVVNNISMYGTADIGTFFLTDQMAADIYTTPEKLWWHSPLKYIGNATTPTLVLHSFDDCDCPISEGYQLFTALMDSGVPARMVCFKDECHELSRSGKPKNRVRRLQEITQWFDRYLKA